MKRLTLSLIFVVVAAILGLGWCIDQWYNTQFEPAENPEIQHYRILGNQLINLIRITNASENQLNEWAGQSNAQLQISAYSEFPLPENLQKKFEAGEPLVLDSKNGLSLHYYYSPKNIVISLNFLSSKQQGSRLSWMLTLLFYSGVIVIVLLWLLPLLKRLHLLRKTAQAFGAGNLSVRIPRGATSYIADIEQEFNRMAQQIENLINDNKLLSRGLSHDLRTPLARLRFGLDVLEEEHLTEKQQKTLAHINRDLSAMEALVETLLSYARLEQGNIAFKPASLDLSNFLLKTINDFYKDDVVFCIHSLSEAFIIHADVEYLSMLVHNLIQNAQRHGKGKIIASLMRSNNSIYFSVEDDGPGIDISEREHVFKPFYRIASAQNTQGHGMGLAIVERIAQWHKADVTLDSSKKLGGLKITVIFRE